MLKKRLTKEEYEALKSPIGYKLATEGEYAGKYVFEGFEEDEEDIGALLRGKERVTKEKNDLKALNDKLKSDLEQAKREAEESKANIGKTQTEKDEELRREVKRLKDEFNAKEAKLRQKAELGEIEKVVSSFAGYWIDEDAAGVGSVFIKNRIKVKHEGDEIKTVFLDRNNHETVMTLDEFRKNVLDDKGLQHIIKSNPSSGGGATPPNHYKSGTLDFSKMTATEKAKLRKSDPLLFDSYANTKK